MQLRVASFYSLLIQLQICLLQAVYLFIFLCVLLFQVFLLFCKSIEPSRLNARDIILLFAGPSVTSVFCSPRKSVSSIDVKGSAHGGREISILEARSAL